MDSESCITLALCFHMFCKNLLKTKQSTSGRIKHLRRSIALVLTLPNLLCMNSAKKEFLGCLIWNMGKLVWMLHLNLSMILVETIILELVKLVENVVSKCSLWIIVMTSGDSFSNFFNFLFPEKEVWMMSQILLKSGSPVCTSCLFCSPGFFQATVFLHSLWRESIGSINSK